MRLYLLRPHDPRDVKWDCAHGFVVRAENAKKARIRASNNAGDEGADFWLDSKKSWCRQLKQDGGAYMIIKDFHAA